MMIHKRASVLDTVSIACLHDAIVVVPTLSHAIFWWGRVVDCLRDRIGDKLFLSHTAAIIRPERKELRLWVPYEPDPTMPMDYKYTHANKDLIDLYGYGAWRGKA